MRAFLAGYATAVLAGFLAIGLSVGWHGNSGVFETTRIVPVNHRLAVGDVAASGFYQRILSWSAATPRQFEGRYVTRPIPKRAAISLADTDTEPVLRAPFDTFLFWTPADATAVADATALDAGAEVELCGLDAAETMCFTHARVAATSCDEKHVCSAGLWIARKARPALLSALDHSAAGKSQRIRVYVRRP